MLSLTEYLKSLHYLRVFEAFYKDDPDAASFEEQVKIRNLCQELLTYSTAKACGLSSAFRKELKALEETY